MLRGLQKLVDGCRYVYESTASKIGPEAFRWRPSDCNEPSHTRWLCDWTPESEEDKAFDEEKKFWTVEPSYNLRPEVIESYYYAYRMTRDKKYQDWAWDAFLAINATTRMEHGFNYYKDVRQVNGPMGNNQESYFFSETLKYLWLIFDEREEGGEWHVNAGFKGEDTWVYNTEGHPLRIK
jgi:mannosyl-oligosaccharide alpha-1,2-mannosidase